MSSAKDAADFENGGLLRQRYRLLGKINEGSYGVVYLAEDTFSKRKVAVKYVYPYGDNSCANDEAEKEIEIYLKLGRHPNIASLVDYFDSFLVLEYCGKGDLYDLIKAGDGPKTKKEILDIMYQMIDLIDYCHKRGMYHRDIKPENIFVTENCQIKLGDWGLATDKRFCSDYDVGSDRYMAPELFDKVETGQVSDNGLYDASKVDLWALGICFLNIIFHKNPFRIANSSDKMFLSFCANREVLFDIFPSMSSDLFNVLRHCLAINPENRDLNAMKQELTKLDLLTYEETEVEDWPVDKPSTASHTVLESSFSTNSKPINITKSYKIHQDRKPLSIQTPFKMFDENYSTKTFNRQDLYTPPSKRLLDPHKYRHFKRSRESRNSFKNTPKSRLTELKETDEKQPTGLVLSSLSEKRKVASLDKIDTTSNIYIPPNLRNRLKSPAYQAKTITTDVYQIKKPSISIDDSFESQLPDDVMFDDLDESTEALVNDLKHLKVHGSSTSSSSTTPRHSDDYTSALPSLVSQSSGSTSSSYIDKQDIYMKRMQNSTATLATYVPPHHRPGYDASKYRRKSFNDRNKPLKPKDSVKSNLLPTSKNSSSATLSASVPQPVGHKFNWADYEDDEDIEPASSFLRSTFMIDNGADLLMNSYTSNLERIPSTIDVQI